jgi:adenylate cyclase
MAAGRASPDPLIERALREEGNAALRIGALVLLALALVNALILPGLIFGAGLHFLLLPWLFTILCAAICAALWALARRGRVHGARAWLVMLPFASLPTFFFLMIHVAMPSGAATFLTGPISYLYFVVVALTGFLFNFRLSVVAGLVAAAGWLLSYFLARPYFATLSSDDPILLGDIVEPQVWFLKAVMLVFGGLAVGALAVVSRRLVLRAVREAEEKAWVRRLFGAYVSEEVAERLVAEGETAGGRREVVVLFSDIRGFTSYSEAADPAEVVVRLNAYFDAMVGAITEHGGVVDKFIGDAIMAVFGGLVPLEDPSGAALRASREMRHRLVDLNRRWAKEGISPFETGIGLHRGEVLQGSIGSADRKDFTVIGDAVNTASRLEGLTKELGCAVVMSEAVHERLPDDLAAECRSLGEAPVKGRRAAVALFGWVEGAV